MLRFKKIFFLFFGPITLFFSLVFAFKINVINCRVSKNNCSQELYQKLEILKGKSLFFVNLDRELTNNEISTETILLQNYQKRFPGTISLEFSEEKVAYQLNLEENQLFISEFGNILPNNQNVVDLPTVSWNSKQSQESHTKILKILNSVNGTDLIIEKITRINDKEIVINIKNNPPLIIDEDSIDSKVAILVTLLNSREIKEYGKPIKEIDLRFNLPVLRTAQ
ncbi:MAG: hypothetical protein COZ34_01810 [Candidatus Pacebacteria bacterium CG_4_10_14_3_um_filter_34_15]|nr:hypothetical protein [Candidatus Pacearchaeota archaeon]NCQ65482.1 hypothetical protein [Candidatus Paceibacterota bacterium]OIO45117.1 MAG: hypothetical protein AUJ41_00650 [Candidatus Pacebacteria bacterium CG1_02_43_31]PIQ81360.1 MAG: hypothetical protein COV78_00500 [Candidatus Pacebacteria bacterium CG11_big_fil_rev_8_21_14_0_20_34_55]PIX81729.1 MAG: hypothetical protein COZ34_01810 [Candidatus Pacebacteria bacterium CG_4_10_14_3_um_filter_34_15]PJC43296.1 MAG: hypothetical protein CO0